MHLSIFQNFFKIWGVNLLKTPVENHIAFQATQTKPGPVLRRPNHDTYPFNDGIQIKSVRVELTPHLRLAGLPSPAESRPHVLGKF